METPFSDTVRRAIFWLTKLSKARSDEEILSQRIDEIRELDRVVCTKLALIGLLDKRIGELRQEHSALLDPKSKSISDSGKLFDTT